MMLYSFMTVAGVAIVVYGVIAYRRGSARYMNAKANWCQGTAMIDQSWLEQMETSVGEGSSVSYRARVAYRYMVDGVEHRGTSPFLCARVNFKREQHGMAWLASVPIGATARIWYDPARPSDAAIELNRPSSSLLFILVAVGLGLIGMGSFLLTS